MKSILMPAALAIALAAGLTSGPIQAAGCLKGAAVGGVAGHHGLLGAGAGCVIGRHEANKHARERAEQDRTAGSSQPGYTGPAATFRDR